jgi:hypothetical protein
MSDMKTTTDRQNGTAVLAENGEEQGGWFPKSLAAILMGVSERTLERRAVDGLLRKRRRPSGVEFLVPVDSVRVSEAERMQHLLTFREEQLSALVQETQDRLAELEPLKADVRRLQQIIDEGDSEPYSPKVYEEMAALKRRMAEVEKRVVGLHRSSRVAQRVHERES